MTTLSWVLAFVGFAALIVLHEAGHFAAAKAVGMRVERFALFFPPLIARKKIGETEYAIGAVPLGGYVRITGMNPSEELPDEVRTRAYYAQPVWKRIVVIAAGPLVNLVLAFALLLAFFWLVGPRDYIPSDRIETVERPPAAGVLESGDRIVSIDGQAGTPEQLSRAIARLSCPGGAATDGCSATQAVSVVVEKPGGTRETVELRPRYDAEVRQMRIGFVWEQMGIGPRRPQPLAAAFRTTATAVWRIASETVKLPLYILDPVRREQISGVVGSYERTRQTIIHEPADTILILAVISLSLAVINLFPFLPLDGGHIFWAIVEKIRRRPVSYATMERAGVIGIMLLIPLFFIGLTNDVERLLGPGFAPPP